MNKEVLFFSTEEIEGHAISGYKLTIDERNISSKRLADYSYVSKLIDILAGRSLTLIESVMPEGKQQEKTKETLKMLVKDVRDKAYDEIYLGK